MRSKPTGPSGVVRRLTGALFLVAILAATACAGADGESRASMGGASSRSQTPRTEPFVERVPSAPGSTTAAPGSAAAGEETGLQAGRRRAEPASEQGRRDDPGRQSAARPAGPAPDPAGQPAVLEDCRERFVIAPGDAEAVRDQVPAQFELRRNAMGDPLLYVSAIRCERYTVAGTTRPTTVAAFAASIESPDGAACASEWPLVGAVKPDVIGSCNNYILFAAYDNPAVVAWGLEGTPDVPTYHIDDLSFAEDPFDLGSLGAPFRFKAGSSPYPYEMDLVVRERPVKLPLTGSFWFSGSTGTVRFRFETNELAFGEASGSLRTERGSEMARLFGTDQPAPAPVFPLMAGNRWSHGTLTKTVFPHDEG